MSDDVRVFVHVPKTAGTSFRMALEKQFGPEGMAYDYGPESEVTSEIVKQHVYLEPDLDRFAASVVDSPIRIICGHIPARKFSHQFGPERTLIMLRDPIQRILSEYQHFVRHAGYPHDFPTFIRQPEYMNRQYAFGSSIPLAEYGYVGITEHYDRSLDLANRLFDWQLLPLAFNLGRPNLNSRYELNAEWDKLVHSLSGQDLKFYARAVQEFDKRLAALA